MPIYQSIQWRVRWPSGYRKILGPTVLRHIENAHNVQQYKIIRGSCGGGTVLLISAPLEQPQSHSPTTPDLPQISPSSFGLTVDSRLDTEYPQHPLNFMRKKQVFLGLCIGSWRVFTGRALVPCRERKECCWYLSWFSRLRDWKIF
jgi:hypothetical protein